VARRKRSISPEEQALQAIVVKGAAIQYVDCPVLATIGYLELWPEHHALFFCEVGDSSTGQQHILEFYKLVVKGDQGILYRSNGDLIASIAPYDDFRIWIWTSAKRIGKTGLEIKIGENRWIKSSQQNGERTSLGAGRVARLFHPAMGTWSLAHGVESRKAEN